MGSSGLLVIAVFALSLPVTASGQAIFTTDPNPLERPAPLKTIKSGDSAKICDAVSKILKSNNFDIKDQDCDLGQFEATRKTGSTGEFDKVLIWLERDFAKPKDVIKLFFLYGRFETLAGHQDPVRIKAPPDLEDQIHNLKDALISVTVA